MRGFNKLPDVLGVIFGLILWYIWFFSVLIFQGIFFAEKRTVHGTLMYVIPPNEIVSWISAGPLILYLVLGHYIFTKRESTETLKNMFFGFAIWLIILAALNLAGLGFTGFLQSSPSDGILLSISAGYVVMFAVYYTLNRLGG